MRRFTGNMMGQRYLGNQEHKEVHDLDNEKSNCEIDKIIAANHDVPFNWLSRANDKGYDNCAYCLGRSPSNRHKPFR